MPRPAGQGESGTVRQPSQAIAMYCSACGRPADLALRLGPDAFCSPAHAEEFARAITAARGPSEARR